MMTTSNEVINIIEVDQDEPPIPASTSSNNATTHTPVADDKATETQVMAPAKQGHNSNIEPSSEIQQTQATSLTKLESQLASPSLIEPAVLQTNQSSKKRTVLIPLDGSDNAKSAFKWYVREMLITGRDEVVFVHVICPLPSHTFNGFSFTILKEDLSQTSQGFTGVTQSRIEEAKALSRRYKARAVYHGATTSKAYIHIHHNAGEAIVESVKRYNIDAVVMGNRGIGQLRRTFLGSVSDYVLHHAGIPVTIVPPPPKVVVQPSSSKTTGPQRRKSLI